jgi:excinuclease ABC subunit A
MHFLPNVYVTCEQCKGRRYNRETLEIRYRGKSIADVLDLTVDQALPLLENFPPIATKLKTLQEVGLGYIELGQSATTLSGGEAQRVKLSRELSRRGTGTHALHPRRADDGLHFEDTHKLLDVLNKLVDQGNTVVIIEHNLDQVGRSSTSGPKGGAAAGASCATPEDVAIDLGPEGGEPGGAGRGSGPEKEGRMGRSGGIRRPGAVV